MTAQLLLYETVVPLAFARHRDAAVQIAGNYTFSKKTNSVPLMAVEFPFAASEYAIVFAGNKDNVMPVVILGVRDRENLYISPDAKWDAKYIPAFVRRYPFVFSNSDDGKRLVLCVDEAFAGFNHEGNGRKIFQDDGKPTEFVDNILKFLQEYQAQFTRTQAFCKKVVELDLLEPMQAQVEMNSGEKLSLSGFMAVNRTRLKDIPPEKLSELAKTDELELLYLHIQSMRNFSSLPARLAVFDGEDGREAEGKTEASRAHA
jgi:hypothetical protein